MSDHDNTPQTPATPEQTAPVASDPAAQQPAKPLKPRRRRGLWIAGGVVAAALLAGGGVAAGAALADLDDDDDDRVASSAQEDGAAEVVDDDTDDAAPGESASGADVYGAETAADIAEVIAAASAVAEGDAVSVDAERDGSWEVQLETEAGDESEVRVAADGTAEVVATETAGSDDRAPENVLDEAAIASLVEAALADTDGTIIELGSDDGTTPYDVTVLTGDGRTVDLELDADLAIAGRDADD
jgi:uncharacterized membrane protein YkoI